MIFILLFYSFFVSALFAFGGGLSIIPFLQNMSVKYGWFSLDDLSNIIGLAEMTPGALGVNMSTYAGYMTAGFWGAFVATLSIALPSFLYAIILFPIWKKIKDYPIMISVFNTIKIVITGLILSIFISLLIPLLDMSVFSIQNMKLIGLFLFLFFLLQKTKIPMALYLILAGVFGIVLNLF